MLILHGVLAWLSRPFAIGLWHDEANYLMLARSLRHLRYRDPFLLGAPTHSQYPPGAPALFAIVSAPFGEHMALLIVFGILCSMGALALIYEIARRCSDEWTALAVLALCAINPELLLYAGHVLSETAYMLLTLLALWAALRESDLSAGSERARRRWSALAIGATGLAALVRSVGVTLMGALFLHWVRERRYRQVLIFTLVGALTVGSWLTWTVLAPTKDVGRSYVADAAYTDKAHAGVAATLLQRVATNSPRYATTYLRISLPQPTLTTLTKRVAALSPRVRSAARVVDDLFSIVLAVLAAIGAYALWPRAGPMVLYLGLYVALLLVWPWGTGRFLEPVIPLLLLAILTGAVRLSGRRRVLRPLPFLIAGGIAVMALLRDAPMLRDSLRCDRRVATTSPACYSDVERGFFAAMSHLRQFTPDTAVVLTTTDAQVGYLANRRALFSFRVRSLSPDDLIRRLRADRVEFVLLTPVRPPHEQLLHVLLPACDAFEVVGEFPAITLLLRLAPPRSSPTHENACKALQRYEESRITSSLW